MHGELWRASAAADTNVTARTRAAGGSTPSHDEGASKVMPAVACHCKIKRQAEAAAWQAVAFAGTRAATCAGAACGRTPLHDEAMSTVVPAAACHRAMKRQARQEPSPLTAPPHVATANHAANTPPWLLPLLLPLLLPSERCVRAPLPLMPTADGARGAIAADGAAARGDGKACSKHAALADAAAAAKRAARESAAAADADGGRGTQCHRHRWRRRTWRRQSVQQARRLG